MQLAFCLLVIAQVSAEDIFGQLAPGDVVDTKPEFAKNELPPVDFTYELEKPAVEQLEAGFVEVDGEASPGDTKTHKAEYYDEFKVDEEEKEEIEMVEVEGKLAEDDTEKHEEIFDDEETIDDYEGLVEEEGEMSLGDAGDHEFQEPKNASEPLNFDELKEEVEVEEAEDRHKPRNCGKSGCNMNGPPHF